MAPTDPVLFEVGDAVQGGAGGDGLGEEVLDRAVVASLTPSQREAVLADDPMVCVLAGAGAGKTRVLTLRVARRIGDGSAAGDRTLVCTFTRKAAQELRDRLWHLGASTGVTAGTIHRTALRILEQHRTDHRLSGVVLVPDRRALVAEALGTRSSSVTPQRVDAEIGWAKATLVRPDGYEAAVRSAGRRPPAAASVVASAYQRYEELRRRRGLLDLDDLLTACADVLAEDQAFASAIRWRYRHLYVDEMQDVNPAQFRLLASLLGDEPDLFVVGDPHQSVYGWNGADPTLLARFPSIFAGTRVIELEANHRCSPEVVAVAAAALGVPSSVGVQPGAAGLSSARSRGPLPEVSTHGTDVEEGAWVARRIWRDHRAGSSWARVAVLARTNAQLPLVAEALERERVPYRIAGGDTAPASDLGRSGREVEEDGGGDRSDDVANDAVDRDEAADVPVVRASYQVGPDEDGVVLSTFHRAKGLEWSSVFVIGLAEGLMPLASARSEAALAEERRLLYVAITRAEDRLHLSWARRPGAGGDGGGGGGRGDRRPSRWLEPVRTALDEMAAAAAPTDADETVARLAALRAQLAARAEDRR